MSIGLRIMKYKEPVVGFEPTACSLRSSYSTTELHRLVKSVINVTKVQSAVFFSASLSKLPTLRHC